MSKKTKNMKVLVIEDDPYLSKVVMQRFSDEDMEADIAGDGDEGIEMLNKNKYALILLDLLMPKKDGYAVMDEIRKRKIDIPVVIFSNVAKNNEKLNYKGINIKEYFSKGSHNIDEMIKMVKFYVSQKSAR